MPIIELIYPGCLHLLLPTTMSWFRSLRITVNGISSPTLLIPTTLLAKIRSLRMAITHTARRGFSRLWVDATHTLRCVTSDGTSCNVNTNDIAGEQSAHALPGGSAPKPTCSSSIRGRFWYVAGGSGVKDSVEVCAKAADDTFAWRTIY